jgi:hypothetical protein
LSVAGAKPKGLRCAKFGRQETMTTKPTPMKMTQKRLGKTTQSVLQPLKVFADLVTNAEPALLFADQRKTLTAIGKLLSLLAEKAECILRDYGVEA